MKSTLLIIVLLVPHVPFVMGSPTVLPQSSANQAPTPTPPTPSISPNSVDQTPAPTSSPSSIPGTRDQWLEFIRVLAGAFAGAGAAFIANFWLQKRARRLDEVAAGNFAMATLIRQYNAFLNIRRGILDEDEHGKQEGLGTLPLWLRFRPITHFLDQSLTFEYKSLTFLFEQGDPKFFERLHSAEMNYREIFGHLGRLNQALLTMRDKVQEAGFVREDQSISAMKVAEIIGPAMVNELEGTLGELQRRCATDEAIYVDAADTLYRAISKHLGPGFRVIRLAA